MQIKLYSFIYLNRRQKRSKNYKIILKIQFIAELSR